MSETEIVFKFHQLESEKLFPVCKQEKQTPSAEVFGMNE